jgi:potassium-transporting ATPase KdpC subunit
MKEIKKAVLFLVVLSFLTGVLYPAVVTILAQVIFPQKAGGSLIHKPDGTSTGSALIGQPFSGPGYFWPRPSATVDFPYNPLASGGSNWGATNPDLLNRIKTNIVTQRSAGIDGSIPADLVTASASGLDPDISLESAIIQIPRVARERNVSEEKINRLVQDLIEYRQFGFLGNKRVNVLKLNLALDNL